MLSVQQKELDPEFHNSTSHTEFRLNDLNITYLSSMRLANLCVFGTNANGKPYNNACGVKALIKNITLYDGSVVLAQLNNSGPYLAFKGINRNNSDQRDKRKVNLDKVAMTNRSIGVETGNLYVNQIGTAESQNIGSAGDTEAHAEKGYLDLSEVLHELRSLRYLPTSLFKNLRLFIQWNTDPKAVLAEVGATAHNPVSALQVGTPLLIVDCISDAKAQSSLLSAMKNLSMISIENERVSIPEVASGDTQTIDLVLKGYDNKTIRRVLFVNSPTSEIEGVVRTTDAGDPTNEGNVLCNGKLNSLAQNNLTLQLTVNGSNLFNGAGLRGVNRRAGVLADTFGDVILTQYGNSTGVYGPTTNGHSNDGATRNIFHFGYGRDYTGFNVNASIRTLQLSYSRTGLVVGAVEIVRPQAFNQALDLNMYAEVIKSFTVSGNSYNIAYI